MADNQRAKHGDSQSGQKNDREKNQKQAAQAGRRENEGNRDSTFAQGGEGNQDQGSDRQSGKR